MTSNLRAASRAAGIAASLCLIALGCASPPVATTPIDWNEANRWSVHIVTEDTDGDVRVARVWLAKLDAAGVVRTGQSRWWKNIERGSFCRVRTGGREYEVAVDEITDSAERRRVDAAFFEKYGWQETLVIPSNRAESDDHYMRLTANEG